jgi:GAF domain-containing protein
MAKKISPAKKKNKPNGKSVINLGGQKCSKTGKIILAKGENKNNSLRVHTQTIKNQSVPDRVELITQLEFIHARLVELEKARARAETLFTITQALSKALSLQEVFEVILSEMQKVVPYDSASVQVVENNRRIIVGGRGFQDLPSLLGIGFDLTDETDPGNQVVLTKRPQVYGDVSQHPQFQSEIRGGGKIRGWIAVPMLYGNRVIGLITLDKYQPGVYNAELAELAMAFAAQAAIAIQNARLFDETQRLLKETQNAKNVAETLRSANLALTQNLDLNAICEELLDLLHQIVPYDSASIFILESNTHLVAKATRGYDLWMADPTSAQTAAFDLLPGTPMYSVISRNSYLIPDTRQAPDWIQVPGEEYILCWFGVPMKVGDKVIGLISLDSNQPNLFIKQNMQLATALGAQAAFAIQNARLFDETQRLLKETQIAKDIAETLRSANLALTQNLNLDAICEELLDLLGQIIPYDSASIFILESNIHLVAKATRGYDLWMADPTSAQTAAFDLLPGTTMYNVVIGRNSYLIPDTRQAPNWVQVPGEEYILCWFGVPMWVGDKIIGVISLDSNQPNLFTEQNMQLATALGAQAAFAIQNARLFDETQRLLEETEKRAAELEVISKVSQALIAESELDSTIQLIGNQMRKIFDADIVYVALLDPQTNLIHFPYQVGENFTTLKLGEGLTSKIIETGEPLLINKDVNKRTLEMGARPVGKEVLSYLGVPIRTGKSVIGVISVQSTAREDVFNDNSLRLLTTIAANAGAALHNAQLFSEALEHLRQVEILTNAARSIENSAYEPAMVESVAARSDALGELARVFRKMADEVRLREQRLKRQLAQLQLDIEERKLAKAETVATYISMDRRQAMANHKTLPEYVHGTALFADVSGFTALTESLANELGRQRGAEEMIRHINRVFTTLIDEVHRYSGAVISFSGDAITCWFNDHDLNENQYAESSINRAVACALAMQKGMIQFATIFTPDGKSITLSIKVALATGPARRMVVGDGTPHQIDVLAGSTLTAMSNAEQVARRGEIVIATTGIPAIEERFSVAEWRQEKQYAVLAGSRQAITPNPWRTLENNAIPDSQIQPWLHVAVFEKVRAGQSELLSELRPATALFMKFGGLDYDNDPEADVKLNTFIQWVEQVIAPHNGSIIQFTVGDKGSYIYVVFGAPIAHKDDAVEAVFTAMELASPPESLPYLSDLYIGLASGQMRVGAYGGSTHRTYGAIGDRANLAARLMMAAARSFAEIPEGQRAVIFCDNSIVEVAHGQVEFESMPPIRVKGKTGLIAIYRPVRKIIADKSNVTARIVELSQLIDNLSPAEQLTIKVASVIGQSFTLEVLSAIYPEDHTREELQTHLKILTESDLINKCSLESSSYKFKDMQTHEVAYNLMLFAQRRQLHRAVAEFFEQNTVSEPHYSEIAHHWQAANEIPRAVHYLEKAGEHARQMGDLEEATRFFNQSLVLIGHEPYDELQKEKQCYRDTEGFKTR